MGIVYLGRPTPSGGREREEVDEPLAAVKVLRPELANNARAVRHFLKEARFQQQLTHANILPVLAVGQAGPIPFLVLPYHARGGLSGLVEPGNPPPADFCLQVARQVAAALAYAHQHGVLHCDLKPANVLLDADGNARLTDFGLARTIFNDSLHDPIQAQPLGTAPYWSPSLARGEREGGFLDDIYSFGALLYELLTGRPPYEAKSIPEITAKIQAGPPVPIRQLQPKASPALALVAEGCLRREPYERYPRMTDVQADLDRIAGGDSPVGPPVPSLRASLMGWARRRPTVSAALALLPLVALGVLAWWTLGPDGTGSPPDGTRSERLELVRSFRMRGVSDLTRGQVAPYGAQTETAIYQLTRNRLLVVSPDGQQLLSTNLAGLLGGAPEDCQLALCPDPDGRTQVMIHWIERTNVYCGLLDQGVIRKRFRAEGSYTNNASGGTKDYNTELLPFVVTRLKPGGKPVLLAALRTGQLRQPRAAVCFDFDNQQLLWRHDVGPQVSHMRVVDTNGQGGFAFVFAGSAVDNDYRGVDGTDDGHSYLWWLDSDGQPVNRTQIGTALSYATAYGAQWDDRPGSEVLVHRAVTYQYPGTTKQQESGALLVFAADGTPVHTNEFTLHVNPFLVADLDGDQREEALTTDRLGNAHLLKSDSSRLSQRVVTDQAVIMLTAQAALDLDGDPRLEVLLFSAGLQTLQEKNSRSDDVAPNVYLLHHNALVVLDHKLNTLDRFEFAPRWQHHAGTARIFARTPPNQPPQIVVLADQVYIFNYLRPAMPGP
jgi:hypothetical protein